VSGKRIGANRTWLEAELFDPCAHFLRIFLIFDMWRLAAALPFTKWAVLLLRFDPDSPRDALRALLCTVRRRRDVPRTLVDIAVFFRRRPGERKPAVARPKSVLTAGVWCPIAAGISVGFGIFCLA
jgi:hypothetical protein